MKILLVEDKDGMRDMLTRALSRDGYEVSACADGIAATTALQAEPFDLVLTDLKLPGKDGFEVLKAAKAAHPDLPVVVMTAFGSIESAVIAMKGGAYDFISKPFDPDHLKLVLDKATQTHNLKTENRVLKQMTRHGEPPEIIGDSAELEEVKNRVKQVAAGDTTVLLTGESGCGKEVFARLVHTSSPRSDGPFIAINCAAIPDQLLESELFGHEKGAFTGASSRHEGKFELAKGGTIFLDEIGDMDMSLQVKLLRVLQDGEVMRVGGGHAIPLDVRVVAATNQELAQRIDDGRFREDLYYRLAAFPIHVPPLRERRGDIPALAEHFIQRFSKELNRPIKGLSPETVDTLMSYNWPGNVRELQNCLERSVILATGDTLDTIDLGPARKPQNASADSATDPVSLDGPLAEVAARAQRHYESQKIRMVMNHTGGNKSKAAELLGVSYKTLLTKIKEYQIDPVG